MKFGLLFLFFLVLLSGCARQTRVPGAISEKEPHIRVGLAENFRSGHLNFTGSYLLELEEANYILNEATGTLTVTSHNGSLSIYNRNRRFHLQAPRQLNFRPQDNSSRFIWNGIPYAGEVIFLITPEGSKIINTLPLETYLLGVVPFEIPTGLEEYRPAVYSQAIAARSYALYHLQHPVSSYFDVHTDVRNQVYRGMEKVTPLAGEAVSRTRGLVLGRGENIVKSEYHSTCGGILISDTAQLTDRPALPAALTRRRDRVAEDFNCQVSPFYRWVEVREMMQIIRNLQKQFGVTAATAETWIRDGFEMEISVEDRSPDGMVQSLGIQVNNRRFTARGYQIRNLLANEKGQALPSNLFFILQSEAAPRQFYVIGGGYGHGRGMCQWGALGMALKGFTYQNILQFYYPDLQLRKIY